MLDRGRSARLGDPYHLLLIGGDEARPRRQRHAHPLLPRQPQLASYLASADAFVHAGMHETFGLVVLEAMACGRPVVAMRAGALPELVTEKRGHARRAARRPAIAAANLAGAIAALYERDLDVLGAAARRHVESNYSWTRALQALMTRYQSAVGARRVPALAPALERAETTQSQSGRQSPARPLLQIVLRPLQIFDARRRRASGRRSP